MTQGVLQSGNITPGHLASWVAPGVIGDGGAIGRSQRVLAFLGSANFNDTSDQPLVLPTSMTAFMLTGLIVTNVSVILDAAVGGFYPEVAKAGTPLVADTQVYSSLTGSTKLLSCTLESAVASTRYSVANVPDWAIYLSLTTGQGFEATADVYAVGIDLT